MDFITWFEKMFISEARAAAKAKETSGGSVYEGDITIVASDENESGNDQ